MTRVPMHLVPSSPLPAAPLITQEMLDARDAEATAADARRALDAMLAHPISPTVAGRAEVFRHAVEALNALPAHEQAHYRKPVASHFDVKVELVTKELEVVRALAPMVPLLATLRALLAQSRAEWVDPAALDAVLDALATVAITLQGRVYEEAHNRVLVTLDTNRALTASQRLEERWRAAFVRAATAAEAATDAARAPTVTRDLEAGDLANASDLVAVYGHEFRYGKFCGWLHWDGRRWQRDAAGVIVQRAKEVARSLLADLPNYLEDRAAVKRILDAQSARRVHAMVSLAESEPPMPVRPEELDTDRWLFNVLNGTLNLRTGELCPHRAEDLITKLAPVTYDTHATCPRWERCLREIFSEDAELIAFVQRFVGHCLTGDVREDVFSIWHGAGGNGKTTIKEILLALFGDYAITTPATTFLEKKGDHIPNDLARLQGARLVMAVEPEQGAKLATAMIKAMTGRDRMDARFLHKEWFSFAPTFKPVLITNKKPVIRETTHAMWRRVRLVPFEVTFQGQAADTRLGTALHRELPGILNWALAGCAAWLRDGLGGAAKVTAATDEYRVESDWFAGFLTGCCDVGPTWEEDAGALYRWYTVWAERSGTRAVSMTTFGTMLTERGFGKRHSANTTYRLGLRLPEGAARV